MLSMNIQTIQRLIFVLHFFIINHFSHAIIGGTPLSPQDPIFGSVVNIKLKNGMCTGSVIAPNVILTAAHCADMLGSPELVAFLSADKTIPCNISQVIDWEFAPNSLRNLPFKVHNQDILLLRLKTPLCKVTSINLKHDFELTAGVVVNGAGHGQGNKKFGQAEFFELKILEKSHLENLMTAKDNISKALLSLGQETYEFAVPQLTQTSFCSGDSGGPVYIENKGQVYQVGLNGAVLPNETFGAKKCNDAYLQLVTPLSPYMDWIQKKLTEWAL